MRRRTARLIRKWVRECNYMQALEGDIDTIHAGFLHYGHVDADDLMHGSCYYYTLKEKVAEFDVIDTEFGATYGAHRQAEEDTDYWRIAHFLMPFYTMNPTGLLGTRSASTPGCRSTTSTPWTGLWPQPGAMTKTRRGIGGLMRGPSSLRGRRDRRAMKPCRRRTRACCRRRRTGTAASVPPPTCITTG